jgi:parallel beta-helix repeat protein
VFNTGDGIRVNSDCTVRGNTCRSNGFGAGDGAGIHAISSDNRIEGNNCTDNDRGIDVDAAGNFIARNTCSGNATNWDVVAGNVCLVVIAAPSAVILGDSGGVAPGSTDPNANFTY